MVCRNGSSQVAGLLLSGATKVALLACCISLPVSLYSLLSVVLFNDAMCMYVYTECLRGMNAALTITRCIFFTFYCWKFILAHPQMHAGIYTL